MTLRISAVLAMLVTIGMSGCTTPAGQSHPVQVYPAQPHPGAAETSGPAARLLARKGTEIVVCGQLFDIGTPVVLWTDPGGYDAYRTERRFAPWEKASFEATTRETKDIKTPERLGLRHTTRPATTSPTWVPSMELDENTLNRVRGGGWTLPELQQRVDQFVYHYDVSHISKICFKTLHDNRGLSVHFMLDLDGTIYQTCDLKERTWHATTSNTRSIGIEIANMGAYTNINLVSQFYAKDPDGRTRIVIPARFEPSLIRTPNFVGRPARNEPVVGTIQGTRYAQYDLTDQQYEALIKLTAAMCQVFPEMKCDYPRDAEGKLIPKKLPDEVLRDYKGLIGHYHIQKEKQDPGPAFDWDRVVNGARAILKQPQVIK